MTDADILAAAARAFRKVAALTSWVRSPAGQAHLAAPNERNNRDARTPDLA